MDDETLRFRLGSARVARLATVNADGRPHLVPCCYALDGDSIISAVDAKPKSTLALRRLANIAGDPRVTLLVDHYEEDWSQLWWVRVDGTAGVLEEGPERDRALAALARKYEQYRSAPPPGPVILVQVDRWSSWP